MSSSCVLYLGLSLGGAFGCLQSYYIVGRGDLQAGRPLVSTGKGGGRSLLRLLHSEDPYSMIKT